MTASAIGRRIPKSVFGHLHYAKTHHLAHLFLLTRADGVVIALTDHNRALTDGIPGFGNTYRPMGLARVSARQREAGLRVQNLEITGMLDSTLITASDLMAGLYRNASIVEKLVDWRFPFAGAMVENHYWVDTVKFDEEAWVAQLSGVARWLGQTTGEIYTKTCRFALGDDRCAYDLDADPNTKSGIVLSVLTSRLHFLTDVVAPSAEYDFGFVKWLTGRNTGKISDVKFYSGTDRSMDLQIPTGFDIRPLDTFKAFPGCDKSLATCIAKFDNVDNYGGFPSIPGTDRLLQESHDE